MMFLQPPALDALDFLFLVPSTLASSLLNPCLLVLLVSSFFLFHFCLFCPSPEALVQRGGSVTG